MLAERVDAVIGADTHRDSHTLILCTTVGVPVSTLVVANTDAGSEQALQWAAAQADPARTVVGLEGTRSYGIGLGRALAAAGWQVVEVERPRRGQRRGRGKSDPIDAHLAALAVLRMDPAALPSPRADGTREALRILLAARSSMRSTLTRHLNQLRALLLTGDDQDRALARGRLPAATLTTLAHRRAHTRETITDRVRRQETTRLARAILTGRADLAANKTELAALASPQAPTLLPLPGVGPVSAAQVLVSWSHPGRCRSEAAFAALAGVSPLPASSGQTTRHRLNRGGDRALNQALHTIVLTRWRTHPQTQAYIQRRRAEGKTDREIRRCLKRYLARQLHRELTRTMT
jgi:transposase